ncbi:MAG: dCTP deaminase [Candidatus Bathyarchaeia archaeon]
MTQKPSGGGLSNEDIKARLSDADTARRLDVTPLSSEQIGPGSIDLTLGNEVGARRKGIVPYIDPRKKETVENAIDIKVLRDGEEYWLMPKEVVLWLTKEYVKLPPDLKGIIFPRSSWMQLFIDTTGFVDAGFEGHLILEIINNNETALVLRPGDRICQIVFFEDKTRSTRPYRGKYTGRDHLEPSKVWKDYL